MKRRTGWMYAGVAALLLVLVGCSKKTETANQTGSDSLLGANPQEQGQGNLTPQQGYTSPAPPPAGTSTSAPSHPRASTKNLVTMPSGTAIQVKVNEAISTETANVGDAWSGTVENAVIVGDRVVIPAGATIHGVVSTSKAAQKGDRATLDLSLSSVEIHGTSHAIHGGTEAIIAGSPRARNLGAIAGGAAAGALIGHAIGGGKGTLIGGVLGGAAASGAVAKSKGYQVELKPGTELTFTTSQSLAVRM
ncbi:MAG TPA: hypothetical protein VL123_08255 [Candidatus Udaeobacter sp.]|nr:hypothetical protein [Candidatus Udaeobacter sp.]